MDKVEQHPVAHDGWDVYRWPEYQALMARMGIPEDVFTRGITIRVYEGEAVLVTHEYMAMDTSQSRFSTDTTSVHNKEFRTSVPKS